MAGAIFDVISSLMCYAAFFQEGDTGAMAGLFMNTLTMIIATLIVPYIMKLSLSVINIKGTFGDAKSLSSTIFGRLAQFNYIISIVQLMILLYCGTNPLLLMPLLVLPLIYHFSKDNRKAFYAILIPLATLMVLVGGSKIAGEDTGEDIDLLGQEFLMDLPLEVVSLLIGSFSVGAILAFVDFDADQYKDLDMAEQKREFKSLKSRLSSSGVDKVTNFYTLFMVVTAMLYISTFAYKTGYFHTISNSIENKS